MIVMGPGGTLVVRAEDSMISKKLHYFCFSSTVFPIHQFLLQNLASYSYQEERVVPWLPMTLNRASIQDVIIIVFIVVKLFHCCFEFVESESNIWSLFWSDYLCQQSARNQRKQVGCRVLGETPCHAAALLPIPWHCYCVAHHQIFQSLQSRLAALCGVCSSRLYCKTQPWICHHGRLAIDKISRTLHR